MKRLEQTISILEMLDFLKDCKDDKKYNLSHLDFIEYSILIFKYRDQTEKLLELQNCSYEYYIYKNILEEDRYKYLEMVNNYFMLHEDFKRHYNKINLYKETTRLVRQNIIDEMLKNPMTMSEVLTDNLNFLKNNRDYFKGVVVHFKGTLTEAKHQHVDNNCLYFVKELSMALDNKSALYETILKNKDFDVKFSNNYFQAAINKMPELKDEILSLRDKFKYSKKDYYLNIKVAQLNNMDDVIIKNVLQFLRDKDNNSFRKFIDGRKELSVYPYDKILDKINSIDNNLYKAILVKELKRNDVLINYINNEYSSFEYFLKVNNIKEDTFNYVLEKVKELDPLTYIKYVDKYNKQTEQYDKRVKEALSICYKIVNGVMDNKGNLRDYNFLDYNLDTNLTLDEFVIIVKNINTISRDDLIKVFIFVNKQLPNSLTRDKEPVIISDSSLEKEYYGVNGRLVSDSEKEAIIAYMDDHNFKRYQKLYEQIIRSYFADELDLSNYLKERKIR